MSEPKTSSLLSLRCEDLAIRIQRSLSLQFNLFVLALVFAFVALWIFDFPNLRALALVTLGSLAPIVAWTRARRPGLPLVALIGLQTLFVFGTPLATRNLTLERYTEDEIFRAAVEVCIFGLALVAAWHTATRSDSTRPPPKEYTTLKFMSLEKPAMLSKLALGLLGSSCLYQSLLAIESVYLLYDKLPVGIGPIIRTVFDGASLAGCLIGGYALGVRAMAQAQQFAFWFIVLVLCALKISTLLLSSATPIIAGVSLGYVIGARRLPTVFLAISAVIAAFFNVSKFEMRAKHWGEAGGTGGVHLIDLPAHFGTWANFSVNVLGHNRTITDEEEARGQQLAARLNNLQNLLFAQAAVADGGSPLLLGETYVLIPKLLIPRLFWPDKPRSHAGQVLLNVHYGRQELDATFTTYVAWGLLAEAYGNFGSIWGPLACGAFLGLIAGFVERWIRPYPITSLEAFLFLIIAANFSLSFEMVASVWVTSVFQMFVALSACVLPFAARRPLLAPTPA